MTPNLSALSIADVLERAGDLVSKPGAWTQGAYARDMFGVDVNPDEEFITAPDAVCWCVYGAVAHVVGPERKYDWLRVRLDALSHLPSVDWNDTPGRTQSEVVAKLKDAASLAREQSA